MKPEMKKKEIVYKTHGNIGSSQIRVVAENGYFRDQLWKQLSRQIRIPTPATCDNRNR